MRERAVAESFANLLGDTNARERWHNAAFFKTMAANSADIAHSMTGKQEEREADRLGLQYQLAAGYDAHGATRVLEMIGAIPPAATGKAVHDPPLARRDALAPAIGEAMEKKGYGGRIGAGRFSRECVERLQASRKR